MLRGGRPPIPGCPAEVLTARQIPRRPILQDCKIVLLRALLRAAEFRLRHSTFTLPSRSSFARGTPPCHSPTPQALAPPRQPPRHRAARAVDAASRRNGAATCSSLARDVRKRVWRASTRPRLVPGGQTSRRSPLRHPTSTSTSLHSMRWGQTPLRVSFPE